MSVLSVQNVGKAFRSYGSEWQRFARWFGLPVKPSEEHWVLRNISFEIKQGEAIGIIGQNGAGKSTLLKMITGTSQPSEGQVRVNGKIAAILELGMGFNPDLTGRENAYHGLGLMGYNHAEVEQVMSKLEAFADIGDYFDQSVRVYSSGMQMRVAFAVVTAFQPDILIVDEALSVGDAVFQRKCFRRIENNMNNGMTLLFVSHDIESIKRICSKALFLKQGELQSYGAAKDVCNTYEEDLFGARVDKNHKNDNELNEPNDAFFDLSLKAENEICYGNGCATIENIRIEDLQGRLANSIYTGGGFIFKYTVCFKKEINSPVFAFMIKTVEGIDLYGTDTIFLDVQQNAASEGDSFDISFHMKAHLAAGTYFLNCGVRDHDDQDFAFLCRRIDTYSFNVCEKDGNRQAGLVNLEAQFSCTQSTRGILNAR